MEALQKKHCHNIEPLMRYDGPFAKLTRLVKRDLYGFESAFAP